MAGLDYRGQVTGTQDLTVCFQQVAGFVSLLGVLGLPKRLLVPDER